MKAAPKVKINFYNRRFCKYNDKWCEYSHPADSCVDKNGTITKCLTKHKNYCKFKGMCKFIKKRIM